jgi:hypothetical protein
MSLVLHHTIKHSPLHPQHSSPPPLIHPPDPALVTSKADLASKGKRKALKKQQKQLTSFWASDPVVLLLLKSMYLAMEGEWKLLNFPLLVERSHLGSFAKAWQLDWT